MKGGTVQGRGRTRTENGNGTNREGGDTRDENEEFKKCEGRFYIDSLFVRGGERYFSQFLTWIRLAQHIDPIRNDLNVINCHK